jgi:hypothetical protein
LGDVHKLNINDFDNPTKTIIFNKKIFTMKWTNEEIEFLKLNYPNKGKNWCAYEMKRSEGSIRVKAAKLNLTLNKDSEFFKEFQLRAAKSKEGKKRPEHSILMSKYAKEGKLDSWIIKTPEQKEQQIKASKEWHKNNEHPKGMLGKTHSDINKEKQSERLKKRWNDKDNKLNSKEYRQLLSDRMSNMQKTGKMRVGYSRGRQGKYNINGTNIFFRSLWEANYALYLDFLKSNNVIKKWTFEEDTFWFEKIKRGVRSYKPDFKITLNNDSIEYHEVKGYMDSKSKTKLNRMRIYYPEIKMVLIEKKQYDEIKLNYKKSLNMFD